MPSTSNIAYEHLQVGARSKYIPAEIESHWIMISFVDICWYPLLLRNSLDVHYQIQSDSSVKLAGVCNKLYLSASDAKRMIHSHVCRFAWLQIDANCTHEAFNASWQISPRRFPVWFLAHVVLHCRLIMISLPLAQSNHRKRLAHALADHVNLARTQSLFELALVNLTSRGVVVIPCDSCCRALTFFTEVHVSFAYSFTMFYNGLQCFTTISQPYAQRGSLMFSCSLHVYNFFYALVSCTWPQGEIIWNENADFRFFASKTNFVVEQKKKKAVPVNTLVCTLAQLGHIGASHGLHVLGRFQWKWQIVTAN